MIGKLVIIGTDAMETTVPLTAPPTVEQLQAAVDGYIETIPFFTTFDGRECIAFCNEEGKLHEMAPNLFAQALWEIAIGRSIADDFLVGPVAIVVGDRELLEAL
jgi:hypothetical protein